MTESQPYLNTLEESLHELKQGRPIILIDNEDRENEGDLVMAAQFVTPEWINFMAKEARGLICAPITQERAKELHLPPMVNINQSEHETAFTVSIDVKINTTTGISSADRAKTIAHLCSHEARPDDFARPGHIFPLISKKFGVLEREGHTEASIDLCKMANLYPCAVICEIMNMDGTMSRLPELRLLAKNWNLKILTISEIKKARIQQSQLLQVKAACDLPTMDGNLKLTYLKNSVSKEQVIVISNPKISSNHVRVHSACMTSEVFGSLRCDCAQQLKNSLSAIAHNGGHLIYLDQEGRGIGLEEKIKAYQLQDESQLDTVDANLTLGHPIDKRTYENAYFALKWLGLKNIELWTNNPKKFAALSSFGLNVLQKSFSSIATSNNLKYLETKIHRMGHDINLIKMPTNEVPFHDV